MGWLDSGGAEGWDLLTPDQQDLLRSTICEECGHSPESHLDGCHAQVGELTCRCNRGAGAES